MIRLLGAGLAALGVALVIFAAADGPSWSLATGVIALAVGIALLFAARMKRDVEAVAEEAAEAGVFACITDLRVVEAAKFAGVGRPSAFGRLLSAPLGGRLGGKLTIGREQLRIDLANEARWLGLPSAIRVPWDRVATASVADLPSRPPRVGELFIETVTGQQLHATVQPQAEAAAALERARRSGSGDDGD